MPFAAPSAAAHHAGVDVEVVVPIGSDGVTYRVPQGTDDGPVLGRPRLSPSARTG